VIACTALYYKIKMNKLELLYEQSRLNYSGPDSFVGPAGYPVSSSSGFAQIVSFSRANGPITSGRVVLPHNGMSTASYIQVIFVGNLIMSLITVEAS
jgi:hypothetical protein